MNKFIDKFNEFKTLNNRGFKRETSAGILIYRLNELKQIEVLLGKNGGPSGNNYRSWNIPKGHIQQGESLKETAFREFIQETNIQLNEQDVMSMIYIGMNSTKAGKNVHIYALEKDLNPGQYAVPIQSNKCEIEWPKGSGKMIQIPELSEAKYWPISKAEQVIFSYQIPFLKSLKDIINE